MGEFESNYRVRLVVTAIERVDVFSRGREGDSEAAAGRANIAHVVAACILEWTVMR